MVLRTRRKWPRPRRDRDVDNFSRDETETRRWYTSRDRLETEMSRPRPQPCGTYAKESSFSDISWRYLQGITVTPNESIKVRHSPLASETRNSSGDWIANVNFLYDDIVHVLQNTIDTCITDATDRRGGYVLERMFTKFSESINQSINQSINLFSQLCNNKNK